MCALAQQMLCCFAFEPEEVFPPLDVTVIPIKNRKEIVWVKFLRHWNLPFDMASFRESTQSNKPQNIFHPFEPAISCRRYCFADSIILSTIPHSRHWPPIHPQKLPSTSAPTTNESSPSHQILTFKPLHWNLIMELIWTSVTTPRSATFFECFGPTAAKKRWKMVKWRKLIKCYNICWWK